MWTEDVVGVRKTGCSNPIQKLGEDLSPATAQGIGENHTPVFLAKMVDPLSRECGVGLDDVHLDVGYTAISSTPPSHLQKVDYTTRCTNKPHIAHRGVVIARSKCISSHHDLVMATSPVSNHGMAF